MHGNHMDDIVAVISGAALSILSIFLKLDWHHFTFDIIKTAEVLWFGFVGGVGGYLGKQIIDKIYKKKKNGNNNKQKEL